MPLATLLPLIVSALPEIGQLLSTIGSLSQAAQANPTANATAEQIAQLQAAIAASQAAHANLQAALPPAA
jgi:hypothetical protein